MPEYVATLLGALIGAVIGSVGSVVVENRLARRDEESRKREALVQRYLYQLQDAAESLWYRLRNVGKVGRIPLWGDPYWETTMLYALGRMLAIERIFALEAVYPQLDIAYPKLGDQLRGLRIDNMLSDQGYLGFYKYERMLLAEAILEHEGDQFRPSTYLEFRRRYEAEESTEREWLEPARRAMISFLSREMEQNRTQMLHLRNSLAEIVRLIAPKTGIATSLVDIARRELEREEQWERQTKGIFISYRRDESARYAGRLADRLSEHFGEDMVFRDIDSVAVGVDFVKPIERALEASVVMIVVIGRNWTTELKEHEQTGQEGYTRLEIATALQRNNVPVIPVLVQGAAMPRADELPNDLAALARRNAIELHDTSWTDDVRRLTSALERVIER